jgi:hypothetical protein
VKRGRVPKGLRYETTESHGLFSPFFSPGEAPVCSDLHNTFSALSAQNLVRSACRMHFCSQFGIAALPFCILYAVKAHIAREQRQDAVAHTVIVYEETRGQAQVNNCKIYERRPSDNGTITAKAWARNDASDSPRNPSLSTT